MDSHTISALNRLEVVETGWRRRWSEEEKARIVLESMSSRVWLRQRRDDMVCRVLCW